MQFSPKKTDIYVSLLRQELQKRILKYGKNKENLMKIKKIEQIRLINNCNEIYKTNIAYLTSELSLALTASLISRGKTVFFQVHGNSYGGINIPVFEGLLCEIAKILSGFNKANRVTIKIYSRFIEITADEIIVSSYLNKLIRKLNGTVIIVKNKYGIKVPIIPTEKIYYNSISAIDYIENPFSAVNLAIAEIKFQRGNYR